MTPQETSEDFRLFAHRGASAHAPENTKTAIRRALEMGARWVEVDVHLCAGRLVVIHDETLDRTTDGRGPVAGTAAEDLRRLDAGDGGPPPWLDEAMDLLDDRHGINVELKGAGTAGPAAELLGRRLDAGSLRPERILVSSFDHDMLRELRGLRPDIPLGWLGSRPDGGLLRAAAEAGAWAVHADRRRVDGRRVAEAHDLGLRVYVYTVNDAVELRRLHALGVDGAFTDHPELAACLGDGRR